VVHRAPQDVSERCADPSGSHAGTGALMTHHCHHELLESREPIRVLLAGVGGTGSRVLTGLRHIHLALLAHDRLGLEVIALDPDTVSETNLVRQAFYPADVGCLKAAILINRLNLACGLSWQAGQHAVNREVILKLQPQIVLSCVDSRSARSAIHAGVSDRSSRVHYWLDFGNDRDTGQVILGEPLNAVNKRSRARLRTAPELFPEIADASLAEDEGPSCSARESLERQGLFVNDGVAVLGLNLLAQLLVGGTILFSRTHTNLLLNQVQSR
jgi:molybdopterin-synthase adenylyltransferase